MPVTPVPGIIAEAGVPWQRAGRADIDRSLSFEQAQQLNIEASQSAKNAQQKIDSVTLVRFGESVKIGLRANAPWGRPPARNTASSVNWVGILPVANIERTRAPWGRPDIVERQPVCAPYVNVLPEKGATSAMPWRSVSQYASESASMPKPRDIVIVSWRRNAQEKDQDNALPWGTLGSRDTTLRFEYPTYTGVVVIPGETIPAVERGTYGFMNTINVTRVSDGVPISVHDINISLDADSWAWKFSGTVIGEGGLGMIKPTASGLVDVQVEINGHTWVFMIESYNGSRKHADHRYVVTGTSKTQSLAAPYAVTKSKVYSSDILAQQVVDAELLSTGFSASFDTTPSWTITANAFSYQNLPPMSVIKKIADAAGAIIKPDKSASSIVLSPRFKISPWALATSSLGDLDAQLPMAMVTDMGLQFQPAPLYDSVFVSGTNYGVSTMVTRAGHGGTSPAPDVFDDLMTSSDVTLERARQVIASSGNRGIYTLTLPLPEPSQAPGLIEPGMAIEAIEGATAWRGYALGVAITAPRSGNASVKQQIKVVRLYEH